jgi:hypothetical protein
MDDMKELPLLLSRPIGELEAEHFLQQSDDPAKFLD